MENKKGKDTPAYGGRASDEANEVIAVLLNLLRRADDQLRDPPQLSPEAQRAVRHHDRIAASLAVKLFTEDRADRSPALTQT